MKHTLVVLHLCVCSYVCCVCVFFQFVANFHVAILFALFILILL